ncbi:hypothetical protein AMC99_00746 [Altererythrobacter epoxidivorans]|uniref:DUF304 domain-containing protein n=1 Tax=Altererythrobacter epoxidivorans TaxID=361183 RepID=A0A0M4MUK6_9SPHN|nr:hypothetical protein [Altererythrobacter epoxidivorans]ALE16050.1 hypothetical protein AMC99_00746 [Altererythrobacter epoxidivorans]
MDGLKFSQDALDLALRRELRVGERVVWQARPLPRVQKLAFWIYLFAIPWTAFSVFWTVMAAQGIEASSGPGGWLAWAFPLFGVPFVVVGLGMLLTPFKPLYDRNKILFAVTNERLLEIRLHGSLSVRSVPTSRIGLIERMENRDGSGFLKVAIGVGKDSDGDSTVEHMAIGQVPDVMTAYEKISEIGRRAIEKRDRSPLD